MTESTEARKTTLRESQKKMRETRKALGFKRIDFWVHEDDLGQVKQIENRLYNARVKKLQRPIA